MIGITIVNARKLIDQDGAIRITLPETITAADITPALAGPTWSDVYNGSWTIRAKLS